ncbi:YvcK family protein [Planomonospora sp. ID82291]|nr:YvcK family protein [Planomonospora sp. ID82291]
MRIALFSGGRGGASIARHLLRTPRTDLSLLINGYDNGHSTGALRRYLPGMLGPSDFRKNLLLHLNDTDPRHTALRTVLEHRLPPASTPDDLTTLTDRLARGTALPALPAAARTAITRDLTAFLHHLHHHPGLDLADCALGNLVLTGAYLRLNRDFNAAVTSCAATFATPARLLNVTDGRNAFLTALKHDGRLLTDEADIVAPQDAVAITDLFLLDAPLTPHRQAALQALPPDRLRAALTGARAPLTLNPHARHALTHADLIVYGPGTPHSSLLPSYLTPGLSDAITANPTAAKVFIVNIDDDHDVQGLDAPALLERTLAYLADPLNERRTVTHVLCHRTRTAPASGDTGPGRTAARWITEDLEDPRRPGAHCGRRTVAALTRIAAGTSLVGAG